MENLRTQQRIYFRNLDILRFFAAYMIVAFHAFYGWKENYGFPAWMTTPDGALTTLGKYVNNAMHNLSFGVEIFFLISGFLITYLLLQEKEKTGKVEVVKFYVRRAFRIWPLYFLLLASAPLLAMAFNFPEPGSYLMHALFAGNYEIIQNGYTSAATNHLWSICVEEHFYLLSPLIIAFIPVKRIPQVFMALIVISIGTRAYLLTTEVWWLDMYMNTLARIDGLAIGSLLGYFYFHHKVEFNDPYRLRYILYGVFVYLFFTDDFVYWDNIFLATVKKYLYIGIAAYWMGHFLFNSKAMLAPKKENILHYFGKLTYALYMFNPVVIGALIFFSYKYPVLQNGWLYMVLVNVIVFGLSIISYKYFEMPFLLLKDKFSVIASGKPLKKVPVVPVLNAPEIVPEAPAINEAALAQVPGPAPAAEQQK
jgi:peptidoglycan/LPS O-acetylase OafA/YrhL